MRTPRLYILLNFALVFSPNFVCSLFIEKYFYAVNKIIAILFYTTYSITMKEQLLSAIEAYCAKHNITEATASVRLMGSGSWVRGLREGRSVTLSTYDRIMRELREDGVAV